MTETSEQYTKDFLKGQETPTTNASGYLQGNIPLANKYNPTGTKRLLALIYLTPILLISAGLLFQSQTFGQVLIFVGIFVFVAYIIFRVTRNISKK